MLYYPTLVWAYIDNKLHGEVVPPPEGEQTQDEEAAGERAPLLR